ncbi:GPW/gp25 family protein [Kiloniella sp. b19]|uniref:GPW/gp25 family protein n=1 Tax=Kiloniella sp. GXU_MW_B19 TaxID=3141326 RepID=UPI0031DA9D87
MMNRNTGAPMNGTAHIAQSLNDLFSTPIGSRVIRRSYGFLTELIDQPSNSLTRQRILGAAATAIALWEPRLIVEGIEYTPAFDGSATLEIKGRTNQNIRFYESFSLGNRGA